MPGRQHLTEEDERAESEARERIAHAQMRLRELRDRRAGIIDQIRQLSDEQHALHDRVGPDRDRVEAVHEDYRALGHALAEVRAKREALRPKLEEALAATRERPGREPGEGRGKGLPRRPEPIREMAELELRQQTVALPLPEENALIDRLRALRKELAVAEAGEANRQKLDEERQAKLLHFQTLRAEFESLGAELGRLRNERDAKMAAIRSTLAQVGQGISELREKARARGELFRRADETNRQIAEVDREIRTTLLATRERRAEARRTIQEFSRSAHAGVETVVAAQTADENFEALMKKGKITLGG